VELNVWRLGFRAWKWLDNMDWERDDQTIKIVDIFFK
jgi:hypothetical protein